MEFRLVTVGNSQYVELLPESGCIENEADALEVVAACGEYETHRLMLHSDNLTPDFYNLRTGLAGEVLQKFVNYWIQVAAVLTPEAATQGRFGEMVLESNRGSQFRVFYTRAEAEAWLTQA